MLHAILLLQPPPHPNCNGDIIAYRVQHRVAGRNVDLETYDVSTPPNAPTELIEHLEPAISYVIRVAARNSSGYGHFSHKNEYTTRQGEVTMHK